ncbi:hypothetical protein DYB25_002130 [Aphanomyces astaci]|uniref:Uncharacterized protein n=2 Tax=Aphanomyces astaci TaxID=112090 RepID=A0A397CV80_APHAT|nr:hypothetical protein DYB25_002130 [Aphanomyces astaci]RHY39498.1 hypothetical protein DYB30_004822 [Aphanomyces astaci]RHY40424.1 hypothetical protein DYB34_005068 [Aphanomyces astaci]RHY53617.1 hypothetical protein DYB38_005854 [Aphanomyces astaci]RHZ01196.1 hypothetical protein DYB31_003941 [Aphanomyces astaci]
MLRDTKMGYIMIAYGPSALKVLVSAMCVLLVSVDVTFNNWELNQVLGNGNALLTPLLNTQSSDDLPKMYSFPRGMSLDTASTVGVFMLNYTIQKISIRDDTIYTLTADSFLIDNPANDICGILKQSYPVTKDSGVGSSMKLGVIKDGIQYVRGAALTNIFHGLGTMPPAGTRADDLIALGYTPSRTETDMRLTTAVVVPPIGTTAYANVSMYRFYPRAFCTGCEPVSELGLDVCTLAMSYNATTRSLVVQSSKAIYGQDHVMGFILDRTATTKGSLYVRGFCVLFVMVAYATSQKTVRWTDGATLTSWYNKLSYMISPTLLRYPCHTFDFSYFCFNSDVFVVGYVAAVLLDEKACNIYSRAMFSWFKNTSTNSTNSWVFVRILAMNFRWMWLNCLLIKFVKFVANYTTATRYTGRNFLVGYFNFSSPAFVYIAGLFFVARNNFLDYGLIDKVTLLSTTQSLEGISVNFFTSALLRGYPSLVLFMLINLFVILTVDLLVNRKWWRLVSQNSLGRQHMFNSTSIIADSGCNFVELKEYDNPVLLISVRSLCTIQWFLTSQTIRFGLPEHPSTFRDMTSKGASTRHKSMTLSKSNAGNASQGELEPVASSELLMVSQDEDGYIHLYNAFKTEVQALSMEVKVLADSKYQLA